MKIRLFNLSPA